MLKKYFSKIKLLKIVHLIMVWLYQYLNVTKLVEHCVIGFVCWAYVTFVISHLLCCSPTEKSVLKWESRTLKMCRLVLWAHVMVVAVEVPPKESSPIKCETSIIMSFCCLVGLLLRVNKSVVLADGQTWLLEI